MRSAAAVFLFSAALLSFDGWKLRSILAAVVNAEVQQPTSSAPQKVGSPAQTSKPTAKTAAAQPGGKKEHTFRGRVEKVDGDAQTLTVSGENVPGWMPAMTMNYLVTNAAHLQLKAGDHITAKVYDGDFTTLHDVRVVQAKPTSPNELPPVPSASVAPGARTTQPNLGVSVATAEPAAEVSLPPNQNAPPQTGASVMVDSVLYPTSVSSTVKPDEPLPATTPELLAELAIRAQSVKMLLDEGNLGGLWVPALRAKDVALALEDNHLNDVAESQRPKLASAVRRLTLAAWQIDAMGDLGNRELLLPLYRDFSEAIADIKTLYPR